MNSLDCLLEPAIALQQRNLKDKDAVVRAAIAHADGILPGLGTILSACGAPEIVMNEYGCWELPSATSLRWDYKDVDGAALLTFHAVGDTILISTASNNALEPAGPAALTPSLTPALAAATVARALEKARATIAGRNGGM